MSRRSNRASSKAVSVIPNGISPEGQIPGISPEVKQIIRQVGEGKARKPSPEEQKYLDRIRDLTDHSVTMVVKVAVCKCSEKDKCPVYLKARDIAEIINELQESKPEGVKVVKSRR